MSNYWIVGSKFGGTDEVIDVFIHRGYWYCWDINDTQEVDETQRTGNSIYNQLKRFEKNSNWRQNCRKNKKCSKPNNGN